MKKSNIISMSMALMLGVSLVAGCGNSEGGQSQDAGAAGTKSNTSVGTEGNEDTGSSSSAAASSSDEDMAEIKMVYMPLGSMPKGLQEVEDAINEITEAEINTHVDIEMIESGSYDQQIGLMMSSGEKLDLMLTLPIGSSS